MRRKLAVKPRRTVSATSNLPEQWTSIHDRFIAYLDTHTHLNADGSVPADEETKERYSAYEMNSLLRKMFPEFKMEMFEPKDIERRLVILDNQENDYFAMPYKAYAREEWGASI